MGLRTLPSWVAWDSEQWQSKDSERNRSPQTGNVHTVLSLWKVENSRFGV